MRAITKLFGLQIGKGDIDVLILRLAQVVCFLLAAVLFISGLLRMSGEDLTRAQHFNAVQQVTQTALLLCIVGLLLKPKSEGA